VNVDREAGEGITLFLEASVDQVACDLAQIQVFGPEPVEPAGGVIAKAQVFASCLAVGKRRGRNGAGGWL
jgi:hypothetical protein